MNDPKRRFFSGDSLQQALVQAANHFHLQPEEIAYHPIEKRHGFVKVRRKVVIEVDPDAPKKPAGAPVLPSLPGAPAGGPAPASRPSPAGRVAEPARSSGPPQAARPAQPGQPARPVRPEREVRPPGRPPAGGPGSPGGPPPQSDDEEEEVDPWNRAVPAPASAHPPHREGSGGGRGSHGRRHPGRQEPRGGAPGMPADLGVGELDEDAQPPGLGQGLVALPERPRNVAERYAAAVGPQAEAAARGIDLLLRIAGLSLAAKVYQGEERLEIDLSGADTDWCFADDGEMLMAIEHLLPRLIRSLSGEAVLCRVDCDNFHEIREERLRSLAQRVADEVRLRGRARTLVPMNPADRRIIHVTLADNPAVVTESEGDGYFKRITVRPA
jgi:spoIIIJ-associated protein